MSSALQKLVSASERGRESFDLGKERHRSWLQSCSIHVIILWRQCRLRTMNLSSLTTSEPILTTTTTEESVSSRYLPFLVYPQKSQFTHQKASRDVTNLSKKTIFLLHRLMMEDSNIIPTVDNTPGKRAALRGREKLVEVQTIYAGLKQELEGDRFWRYQSQVSPGLQEYIEALGFAHYLEYGSLITFDQVQRTLADSQGVPVSNRLELSCVRAHVPILVLSFDNFRLPFGFIRFDGRTHAICHLWHLSKRRSQESQ